MNLGTPAPAAAPAQPAPAADPSMDFADPTAAPAPEAGGGEMPFEKEPFNAGVEADEAQDPKKFIEQLSGKLGQSLRKYATDQGQPDFKLEKFAINSVISATHTAEMDPKDKDEIIKKINTSGNDDQAAPEASAEPTTDDSQPPTQAPDEKPTDEQTLMEMSLNDVNTKKLIDIYQAGGKNGQIVYKLVTHRNDFQNSAEFMEALKDYVDYEELNDIFARLKELGIQVPQDHEQPVFEGLQSTESLRIFEDKTNSMSQPTTKPAVKPRTAPATKPATKPSRRSRPFQPIVTPGVQPDPKALA